MATQHYARNASSQNQHLPFMGVSLRPGEEHLITEEQAESAPMRVLVAKGRFTVVTREVPPPRSFVVEVVPVAVEEPPRAVPVEVVFAEPKPEPPAFRPMAIKKQRSRSGEE